jgi:hypothetical protein
VVIDSVSLFGTQNQVGQKQVGSLAVFETSSVMAARWHESLRVFGYVDPQSSRCYARDAGPI